MRQIRVKAGFLTYPGGQMHLTSVTVRAFKSFADRTRLDLEPGLTAVVGPNGAGKSNLIDALLWALGTQGTRVLRAERMEDVIFTGTTTRPALGMSQVTLTFDNGSGTFPLDFLEVQIGRTLFRDGASEYSLNGANCRLLDVQEMLAEAGIGREMHVVVAQGQVEEIVQAKPEELRSYVEEAAGISKHRRRKERALRKIDQVDQDIARAADVLGELRRQLRPLESQVAKAQAHQELTKRLREVQIRIAVTELEALDLERRRALETRESATTELVELRGALEVLRDQRTQTERRLDDVRTRAAGMRRGLESLRNAQAAAFRAVVVLRERVNAQPDVRRHQSAVAKLEALETEEHEVRSQIGDAQTRLSDHDRAVQDLRLRRAEAESRSDETAGELLQIRDSLTGLDAESRSAEQAELTARAEARGAQERAERAGERIARFEQQTDAIRADIERLDAEGGRAALTVERLDGERRDASTGAEEADRRLRSIETQAAVLAGRLESLRVARELAVSRRTAADEFKSANADALAIHGVLGDLVRVAPGLEAAVEAALGAAIDAVVVPGAKLAESVTTAESDGKDVLLAPTLPGGSRAVPVPDARPLAEAVDAPAFLRGTVDALLDGVFVVDDWERAVSLAARYPHATFVTLEGRLLRARGVSRPAPSKRQSGLGITDALERTEESIARLEGDRSRFTTTRDLRRREVVRVEGELEEARSQLHEIEGRIAAAADRMREIGAESHAAELEADLATQEHHQRLTRAEEYAQRRRALAEEATVLRGRESERSARMSECQAELAELARELSAVESGSTELLTRRAELSERLRGVERSRDEARSEAAEADVVPADPTDLAAAESALHAVEELVSSAGERVRELFEAEEDADADVRRITADVARTEVQIASLEPRTLSAAETLGRLDSRLEEVGSRLAREHGVPPSHARREFPADTDLETLQAEEARAAAELKRLGPVNPLAAQEIGELQERKDFLEAQLEDLRRSKRDLLRLVRAAEDRMRELLVSAVEDADTRFREVAGLLFPEGDGRLRLVGDEDPLEGRLEIEVRLGRKGHRRLAFLSGGEKALAGLAFLFALHLARPTPFLVLDEVDAPLDDANLSRFLRLLDSLRHRTQVLVVTHQKRTMERADSLVGVTLNPDGTSRIVTQRLHEPAPAPSPAPSAAPSPAR